MQHWTGVDVTELSSADRTQILEQLEQILASRYFSSSKRYPSFLRFVVESALSDPGYELKERTLGTEVFNRSPTYDTATDPVVRIIAGEVRKRIAQYYQQPAVQNQVRIILPVGSYSPKFYFPRLDSPDLPAADPVLELIPDAMELSLPAAEEIKAQPGRGAFPVSLRQGLSILLGACCIAGLLFAWRWIRPAPTAEELFWKPALESSRGVILYLADQNNFDLTQAAELSARDRTLKGQLVSASTLTGAFRIRTFFTEHHVDSTISPGSRVKFNDLQDHPSVLIGGVDDPWISRMVGLLPFKIKTTSPGVVSITGSGSESRHWDVDTNQPFSKISVDYGIIARVNDPLTGQVEFLVLGITEKANYAVSRAFADSEFLASSQPDWSKQNMEFVISTKVVDGISAPPQIVAEKSW